MTSKVLIVDDERKIREIVRLYLERDGFQVFEAKDGLEALELFRSVNPDLVVLDLMLPKLSGEEVAALIREQGDTPIIMLTAKVSEDDRIQGLRGGADDYVTKPFSPKELVARVQAVLRRSHKQAQADILSGDEAVRINLDKHAITVQGQPLLLTPTEHKLLVLFVQNPGVVFSRGQLADEVLGWNFEGYEETIYVHIKNLRKKLGELTSKRYIKTVYGVGYRWLE